MTPQPAGRVVDIGSKPPPRRQSIIDLLSGFTTETTPGAAAKIADYRSHLRPGRDRVHHLPAGVELRRHHRGRGPAAPRRVHTRSPTSPRAASRAGRSSTRTSRASRAKPASTRPCSSAARSTSRSASSPTPCSSSTPGCSTSYGIGRIGIAGHPEGSPDIPDAQIRAALAWKNDVRAPDRRFPVRRHPVLLRGRSRDRVGQTHTGRGQPAPRLHRHPRPRVAQGAHRPREGLRCRPIDALPHPPGPQRHEAARGHRPRPPRFRARGLPRDPILGAASAASTSIRSGG